MTKEELEEVEKALLQLESETGIVDELELIKFMLMKLMMALKLYG